MVNNTKITICGSGTLGANLAENLARIDFKVLTVIDKDIVENKNLINQPYFTYDIGKPKVKAISDLIFSSSSIQINKIYKELTRGNALQLLKGAHLVIDMFDNIESREIVLEICRQNNVPCLHAGISNDGYGEVIWNEHYKLPKKNEGEDPCDTSPNRDLSLMVIAITTEVIIAYLNKGEKKNYSITLDDLVISELKY